MKAERERYAFIVVQRGNPRLQPCLLPINLRVSRWVADDHLRLFVVLSKFESVEIVEVLGDSRLKVADSSSFILGIGIFAIGLSFLSLSVAINTSPPAPYMERLHKRLLIGGSIATTIIGLLVVRFAGRMAGW